MSVAAVLAVLADLPIGDPTPKEPPGASQILGFVGNVKWGAAVALLIGFFVGLIVWSGGRWVDHHRAGRVGVVMMLVSVAGALLYGISYQLINYFSKG